MSLKKLIWLKDNGWLDDTFMNFMMRLLNFYNFYDKRGTFILARHVFGNKNNFITLVTPCHDINFKKITRDYNQNGRKIRKNCLKKCFLNTIRNGMKKIKLSP